MTSDFDQEIDSILRQAARQPEVSSSEFSAHLDAEEIALFAENALAAGHRQSAADHLAECSRCRKILVSVVQLDSESSEESAHAVQPKVKILQTSPLPWYQRFFSTASLAVSMGALAILLGGIVIFVLLPSSDLETASTAQPENYEMTRASGPSADADFPVATAANSNATAAIVPQETPLASPTAARNASNNTNSGLKSKDKPTAAGAPQAATVTDSASQTVASSDLSVQEQKSPEPKSEQEISATPKPPPAAPATAVQSQVTVMPDSQTVTSRKVEQLPIQGRSVQQLPMLSSPEADQAAKNRSVSKTSRKPNDPAASARKTVGGKSFIYNQGAWYDTAYNQQKTSNISRRSAEFNKLDAGLRAIADSLSGVIVVVWNGKAYRIQ